MKILRIPAQVLFLMIPFWGGGCAALQPYVQDFNLVSIEQEKELSVEMAKAIDRDMTFSVDHNENSRVDTISRKLISAMPESPFVYDFFVVKDETPNAFTIPGGLIYVHTGLLKVADDEELAGVLAHELGHAYERHPSKALSRAYGLEYLKGLLFKGQPENENKFRIMTLALVQGGVLSKYGRDDERESDEIGYYLTKRAGYGSEGLLRFLQKLEKLQQGKPQAPAFLRSHPPTPERIENLRILSRGGPVMDPANTPRYWHSQTAPR